MSTGAEVGAPVSFSEACRFWIRLGFISFGGPAGQIATLHREVVDWRKWVTEEQFLHALNFCMLLLPSILFILIGAPYVETLRGSPRLQAALGGITAAVVGLASGVAGLSRLLLVSGP